MKYNLLWVDPPWPYNQRAAWSKTRFGGGASSQYPVMTDDRLFGLKTFIDPIIEPDCMLLLWAVWPKMDIAIDLIRAWGFKFSTRAFTWIKTYHNGTNFRGPGASTASNDENIILAYRGKFPAPAHRLADGIFESYFDDSVIKTPHPRWESGTPPDPETGKPRSGKIIHSAKPEEFRQRIEALWPNTRKLEMFARIRAQGWTSVGLDITGNDIATDLGLLSMTLNKSETA